MIKFLKSLWVKQEGQNLPEFALLLVLICLTAVSAMGAVAVEVNSLYCNVSTHVTSASNPALTGGGSIGFEAGAPVQQQTESTDTTRRKPTN
jgi:Flp pilus assembly pilin Flp